MIVLQANDIELTNIKGLLSTDKFIMTSVVVIFDSGKTYSICNNSSSFQDAEIERYSKAS